MCWTSGEHGKDRSDDPLAMFGDHWSTFIFHRWQSTEQRSTVHLLGQHSVIWLWRDNRDPAPHQNGTCSIVSTHTSRLIQPQRHSQQQSCSVRRHVRLCSVVWEWSLDTVQTACQSPWSLSYQVLARNPWHLMVAQGHPHWDPAESQLTVHGASNWNYATATALARPRYQASSRVCQTAVQYFWCSSASRI